MDSPSGGYSFILDAGFDKAIWFITDSQRRDRYNIRVSISSLYLAINGYKQAKEYILDFLINSLGAKGKTGGVPQEKISRVDFAMDFITSNFAPDTSNFIVHSRTSKSTNIEETKKGRETISIRVGKMPNRQVGLYNKTVEIIASNKPYWWSIWDIDKEDNKDKQIWRVEVRAGKDELNKWTSRTYIDFEKKVGDIIQDILNKIRYTVPDTNTNQSRWQNAEFWDVAINRAKTVLQEYSSNANRAEILQGKRNDMISDRITALVGNLASYAALLNIKFEEIVKIPDQLKYEYKSVLRHREDEIRKKYEQAKLKYSMLT